MSDKIGEKLYSPIDNNVDSARNTTQISLETQSIKNRTDKVAIDLIQDLDDLYFWQDPGSLSRINHPDILNIIEQNKDNPDLWNKLVNEYVQNEINWARDLIDKRLQTENIDYKQLANYLINHSYGSFVIERMKDFKGVEPLDIIKKLLNSENNYHTNTLWFSDILENLGNMPDFDHNEFVKIALELGLEQHIDLHKDKLTLNENTLELIKKYLKNPVKIQEEEE